MKVIITGGTGLIGSQLSETLVKDGHEVIVLSRNPKKYSDSMPKGVKVMQWDAKTADGWGAEANGAYAIVNLAGASIGEGRWTKERKEIILSSRINAGKAVVEAVTQAQDRPKMVIQASAVGYYGTSGKEKLTERSPSAKNNFQSEVSVPWEDSTAVVKEMGVRHIIARIGVVLSTESGALPKLMMPFKMMAGGPLGSGEQWMSWVHKDDVVRALLFLLKSNSAEGAYNVTSPSPIQNAMVARKLGTVMNRPSLLSAPALGLRLALGEMSELVLTGNRVIPEKITKEGFNFRYPEFENATRNLIGSAPV